MAGGDLKKKKIAHPPQGGVGNRRGSQGTSLT